MNAELKNTAAQSPEVEPRQLAQLPPQNSMQLYTPAEYSAILKKLENTNEDDHPIW